MWNKELWLQTNLDRVLIFWNIKFVQIWILLRESNRNRFNTMIRVLYGPFHTTVILQIPYGYKLSRGNKFHGFRWCFGLTKMKSLEIFIFNATPTSFTHVRECETCMIMALLRYLSPVNTFCQELRLHRWLPNASLSPERE